MADRSRGSAATGSRRSPLLVESAEFVAPRRAIIQALGEHGELTLKQIEDEAARRLPTAERSFQLETIVDDLLKVELITESDGGRFVLTETGRRRFEGIRVRSRA